jgi:outer membrane protein assembly factor BamB
VLILDSSNKHVIYAVDPNDIDDDNHPHIEWKFSGICESQSEGCKPVEGLWIAPPLVVENRLFAPNSDGNVYVLDLQDGQSEKEAIAVIEVSESQAEEARLWAQPVTDGERMYVTSLDKSVIAIDLTTYEVLWHADLGGAVPGGLAIGGDGMLYVGSLAKQLERFDPVTGAHDPVLDTNGWIWGTPVAAGDNLYFGDVEGYFYSYNTAQQKLNWEPVQPDAAITASPLVLGDQVLVATESGTIFSISPDGDLDTWFQPGTQGKAYTTPVSAGGFVLVAYLESDYYLVALDDEGDDQWKYPGE